ncbi:MAG: PAS domain S-box protein, partial [Candidatus Cloacimonadaceae bacterium]|nr:PAS domain S-box protein [Candidatus Cloacimonadaceae bacterium]
YRLILTDETERVETERALNENIDVINRLFDSALDLLCIANSNGVFVKLSQEWERTLGFPLGEMEGKHFLKFVHPDDRETTISALSGIEHDKIAVRFLNRVLCSDGGYRWIEWRAVPSGKLIYASARDVSDRKHTFDQLQESEERFRSFFEASNVGKSITAPSGELNVNQAYADMMGYTIEELNGKKWQDLTPQEDIVQIEDILKRLENHEKISDRFVKRYICKDGSILWGDVSVAARYDENNKLQYFLAAVVDITEKRKAESKYMALFNEMLDGLALHEIILDEDEQPIDYRFLAVNPAFERLTGLSAKDIIGKTCREVLPNTERYWIETYGKVALTGIPAKFENYSQDLDKFFNVTSFRPAPMQFVSIFSDITETKRLSIDRLALQEQLYQMQKMESVGRLAGGVAHDFNNMLGIIMGHAELAMDEIPPDQSAYLDLQQILIAAKRSSDLTKQLLAFARKQPISPKIVDLN